MSVVIETTFGDITVDLYVKERPRCCQNFLKLCKIKYYNFSLFHFVQKGFIAQTGDPTGTGRGGHSINSILYGEQARYFEGEKIPRIKHKKHGTLSMVSCGDNIFGSQFFVTLSPELDYLDDEHCAFGEVVEGFEVLEKFNNAICDDEHKPYQDIRITHTVVLDDPYDDPKGLDVPPCSPEPTQEILDSGRIGADEEVDDQEGKTLEEMEEIIQEKEAKARATILEMVGDLPTADIAPPENVLFVCKLNPVTTDDDLEIIFSRFGRINSCEVIRDQKTGESLQYAFIEFQDRKACEDAYFKMDNVLIDDRRIHVDFSQSVSQYKWKGKGRGVQVFEDNKNGKTSSRIVNSGPSAKPGGTTSSSSANKQWSRSPPRYSRGHALEQKRKSDKVDTTTPDDRLLELLRKDLLKSKKDKSKSSKSKKHESSSSENDSSSSSSSSSSSKKSSSSESDSKSKKRRKR